MRGAGQRAGDGGNPAAGGEIQHPAAGDALGMVQHVARQRLPSGPGERPERRLDVVLGQPGSSVACQIGVISLARCRVISGTRGAAARIVWPRTNAAALDVCTWCNSCPTCWLAERTKSHSHPINIAAATAKPDFPVRPEQPQAQPRIVDVQRRAPATPATPPAAQSDKEPPAQPDQPAGNRQQHHRAAIAHRQERRGAFAEQTRGRLHPDQRIVLAILMGIDRVEAEVPQHRRAVQHRPGQIEPPGRRRHNPSARQSRR